MTVLVFTPLAPKGQNYSASRTSIRALRGDFDVATARRNDYDPADNLERLYNVLENYQAGRKRFLAGDYEAMLTVESDVIVPPDALEKLLAVEGAGVVYGLYCLRRDDHEWCLHGPGKKGGHYLQKSFSRKGLAPTYWGGVHIVGGLGLGCTLIRREVLERFDFRMDVAMPYMACDWWLAVDCTNAGIIQKGHAGVICGHIRHEENDVLWPTPSGEGWAVRPLRDARRY